MEDCSNMIHIRIFNQSMQVVRAVARSGNGEMVDELSCQMVAADKSEDIYLPKNAVTQNATIDLYTCNTVLAQWDTFATVPIDTLDVDLLWVTEVNGVVSLTPYGCTNMNDSGQLYYIQLHNNLLFIERIYVSYYVDSKFYSKRMSPVIKGGTKKVWVPIEATSLTLKVQIFDIDWKDSMIFSLPRITDNCCYESYLDKTHNPNARLVTCT